MIALLLFRTYPLSYFPQGTNDFSFPTGGEGREGGNITAFELAEKNFSIKLSLIHN